MPAPAATHANVTIDNSLIASLASDRDAVRDFPCLRTLTSSAGCSSCGQPRQQRINYDQIKQCLAQMPMDKRAALRKRLNTARVTVVIKNQVIRL